MGHPREGGREIRSSPYRQTTLHYAIVSTMKLLIGERPTAFTAALIVPHHEKLGDTYLGGIKPGYYWHRELVWLLRRHKGAPKAIQFIADMLE